MSSSAFVSRFIQEHPHEFGGENSEHPQCLQAVRCISNGSGSRRSAVSRRAHSKGEDLV